MYKLKILEKLMKKYHILVLLFYVITNFAQTTVVKKRATEKMNRWSLDFATGQSRALAPYTTGYFSSNQNKFLGNPEINYFGVTGRYMFSPKFGVNFGVGYNTFKNSTGSESLPFEMRSIRYNLQGVVNASRLFDIQESLGRFGLLFHGGVEAITNTPQMGVNKGSTDFNTGFIAGIAPQYRLTSTISVFADVSGVKYIRQNLNWDGGASQGNQSLAGALLSYTLGLSFSIGKGNIHGDWAEIPTKTVDLKPLEDRINKMESMILDSDQDGITDFLDVEKNSTVGALVDAKGRMIDRDRNGIADELEKYLDGKGGSTASAPETSDMVAKYINDGYVAAYFDYEEVYPTQISQQCISLLASYTKNNAQKNIFILGYANATGNVAYNKDLASKRAEIIKTLLIKAGVAASRLTIMSNDETDSLYYKSAIARSDARRITFKIQ